MKNCDGDYYNTFVRVRDLGVENAEVFSACSLGVTNFATNAAEVEEMEQYGASWFSCTRGQMTMQNGVALDEIREEQMATNCTTRALAVIIQASSNVSNACQQRRAKSTDRTPLVFDKRNSVFGRNV